MAQSVVNQPSSAAQSCRLCGTWPACSYIDLNNKNSGGRICEEHAAMYERKDGRLVLNKG